MNNNNDDGGYFCVRDRLFDWYGQLLGPIAIAVYNYLARCADQDGCCFPSYEDIARKVGISRSSALRAIAKLVKYNLITVKRRRHRQEHRGDHTSNCYKIRLEAFTDKGAHREVVSQGHQLVSQGHSKDYPLKDNPIKEKERGGEPPPSTPPDSLPTSLSSSQEETTQTAGENPEAVKAQSTGEDARLVDPIPAAKAATKANGKPTKGRKQQHRGNNGAGQPSPVPWPLSDDDIRAIMQETGWSEAKVKDEAPKFRDHHLSRGTLSCDWLAQWRIWKRRGDEWESREREHMRANGKVEKTAPRPPLFVAEPKAPIDPSKPRPSHMPMVLEEIARQERARRAAQP